MTRHRRSGELPWWVVAEPSPLTEALGDLDRANLRHNYRITPPSHQETTMPDPTPPLSEWVTRPELDETVDTLTEMFTKGLDDLAASLERRLAAVESKRRKSPVRDPAQIKIDNDVVVLLDRVYPVKLRALEINEALEVESTQSAMLIRLRRLVAEGRIVLASQTTKKGATRSYERFQGLPPKD